ncbi:MAG: hypothetical protein JXR83_18960 [Deltaproteobacteria bacterium]|nr:hypothetical protein [Deltaproteobacteria bacterium]
MAMCNGRRLLLPVTGGCALWLLAALGPAPGRAQSPGAASADDSGQPEQGGELDFLSTGGLVATPEQMLEVEVDATADEDGDQSGQTAADPQATGTAKPDDDRGERQGEPDGASDQPQSSPATAPASAPDPAREPWLANLPDCLAPLARRKQAVMVRRDEKGVVVDHSCSSWGVAPLVMRNILVTATYEGDGDSFDSARLAFKSGEQITRSHLVSIGDRMNGGAIVVAVGPGVVLFDAQGKLVAATDGMAIKMWRMVWHSGFVLSSDAAGSGAGATAAKSTNRDIARAKASVKPRVPAGNKKK